jgi:TrpR family trp operon transcriptional repressor
MKNNSEQYKKEVVEVIYKIAKDKGLLTDFIKEILTPREFENIGVRWQIVKRLSKGEHHAGIAEDLHLGVATVTRGSREMRKKEGGFRRALKILENRRK